MLNYKQSFTQYFRLSNSLVFQIIVGCSFGGILGIASLRFSPLLVLGAVVAIFSLYAVLKRPELALLGILVATSSIVFEDQLPMLSLGISLHTPDILLLGALSLIVIRWVVEPKFRIVRTSLDWPLLSFFGMMLLSTLIAIFQASVGVEPARREIRVIAYYLTFFVVTNLVRDRRQLNFLLNGLFLLATFVAAAMVAQFLLGDSVHLIPGRVESLNTMGVVYNDVTRILPPGWSIVLVSFVAILCILVLEKFKPLRVLKLFQCGLLGIALLVTFLRSYWAVLILVFFLLVFLFRGGDRQKLILWGFVVLSAAVIILLLVFSNPDSRATRLVSVSIDRLSTVFSAGTFQGQDGSLNWRKIENEYAISTIASHPLIGLGMSARYRPWDPRLDAPVTSSTGLDFRTFIHNGHFGILLDSGLLGYLSLLWLSLAFLLRGLKYWRSIANNRMRGVVLGFTLVYLAILVAAAVNSTFTQWRWTPVIGIMMGVNEVILTKVRQKA